MYALPTLVTITGFLPSVNPTFSTVTPSDRSSSREEDQRSEATHSFRIMAFRPLSRISHRKNLKHFL